MTIGYPYAKKKNFNPYLVPHKKINSKWLTDISVKPKTITFIREHFGDIWLSKYFLDMTSKV